MRRPASRIFFSLALPASIFLASCSPIDPPLVDASTLPDSTNTTGPYEVTARVQSRRSISSVVLVWENIAEDSVQAVRTAMVQDSSGVYRGDIPGQGPGAVIAFHVEATDSSGDTGFDPQPGSSAQCGDNDCFNVLAQ